jgi:hypothetical protein
LPNTRFDGNNWVRLFWANIWLGRVFFGSMFNLWGQTWPKHGEPVCLHWFCWLNFDMISTCYLGRNLRFVSTYCCPPSCVNVILSDVYICAPVHVGASELRWQYHTERSHSWRCFGHLGLSSV